MAQNYNKESVVNFLVWNKLDYTKRGFTGGKIQFAEKNKLSFYETSAKYDENVGNSFYIKTKMLIFHTKNDKLCELSIFCDKNKNTVMGEASKI